MSDYTELHDWAAVEVAPLIRRRLPAADIDQVVLGLYNDRLIHRTSAGYVLIATEGEFWETVRRYDPAK